VSTLPRGGKDLIPGKKKDAVIPVSTENGENSNDLAGFPWNQKGGVKKLEEGKKD